jgi:2-iminobutanoate/2-iminopropanoate deaminase
MEKKIIKTDRAPAAIGPYSVGVLSGNFVFTAGQLGLNPATGELVSGGIQAQTRQTLTNIQNILEAVGSSMNSVVKTTVFLLNMQEFAAMNEIYGEFFQGEPPARTTVQVASLPKNAAIEIEAIAIVNK